LPWSETPDLDRGNLLGAAPRRDAKCRVTQRLVRRRYLAALERLDAVNWHTTDYTSLLKRLDKRRIPAHRFPA
jgi:hypothetical protein